MFGFFKKLFSDKQEPVKPAPMDILRKTGAHPMQRKPIVGGKQSRAPRNHESESRETVVKKTVNAKPVIEDGGPGKNVMQRRRFVREDTGTHETLKIVDETMSISDDEPGIDPYNTGQFDRSKTWGKHFNK